MDTSNNYMKVFSACMVNLPPQEADNISQEIRVQQFPSSIELVTLTMLALNFVSLALLLMILCMLVKYFKKLMA